MRGNQVDHRQPFCRCLRQIGRFAVYERPRNGHPTEGGRHFVLCKWHPLNHICRLPGSKTDTRWHVRDRRHYSIGHGNIRLEISCQISCLNPIRVIKQLNGKVCICANQRNSTGPWQVTSTPERRHGGNQQLSFFLQQLRCYQRVLPNSHLRREPTPNDVQCELGPFQVSTCIYGSLFVW